MSHATTPEAPVSSAVSEFPRCQYRMRKGRCRELVSDSATGLCFKHTAQLKKQRDAANLAAQLIGDTQEFTSAVAINRSLGELYKLLARDEIAPRRAAVMAYTGSLLLRTLPAMEHELGLDDEYLRVEPGDIPRPDRSQPYTGVVHPTPAEISVARSARESQRALEAQCQNPERAFRSSEATVVDRG